MTFTKEGSEQRGLLFEVNRTRVVPNKVISFFDFQTKIPLGMDDSGRGRIVEAAQFPQPTALRFRRASDHDDLIKMRFSLGFKKKRDINTKPVSAGGTGLRPGNPAVANHRVKDRFKFTAPGGVRKNQCPQACAIKVAAFIEKLNPKGMQNCGMHLGIVLEQIARDLVRIEKLGGQIPQ